MRKLLAGLLTISLLMSIIIIPGAFVSAKDKSKKDDSFEYKSDIPKVTQEQEDEYLKNADKFKIYLEPITIYDNGNISIQSEIPGEGATQVWPYSLPGSGYIGQDDKYGLYNDIKNFVLIATSFSKNAYVTAGAVVVSVFDAIGEAIPDSPITAEVGIMYRYIGKEGQVYDSSQGGWGTYWDTRSRETYQVNTVYYYDENNMPKADSVAKTIPMETEYSDHYFDNQYISDRAWENWYWNLPWMVETW